jgi:hypothetical protein
MAAMANCVVVAFDQPDVMVGQTNGPNVSFDQGWEPDLQRRVVLAGLAAAWVSPFVPAANAQPAAGAAREAFLNVSKNLTGRSPLDPEQCARLHKTLTADAPRFDIQVQELLAFIADRGVDAAHLQRTLDAEGSPLASLPRKIVTAWYTGIVGEGGAARCVTFETSLMHQVVADRLDPPSYCHGRHGSWTENPV